MLATASQWILELGEHSSQVHQSLAADIRTADLDSLHLLGEHLHAMNDRSSPLETKRQSITETGLITAS
jgi:UDP-N-acetylmuramyl pentapeptide synthase